MNKPRNGNTLTKLMIDDLIRILSSTADNRDLNCIVLNGNGKFFCTGIDLGESSQVSETDAAAKSLFKRLLRLFGLIDESLKVTIPCLNGPALGGVGLVFACDL